MTNESDILSDEKLKNCQTNNEVRKKSKCINSVEELGLKEGIYSTEELKTLNSKYKLNTVKLIENFEEEEQKI